jgi:hypothetical protein
MAIARKPKSSSNGNGQASQAAINALVNKGGSTARMGRPPLDEASRWVAVPVNLRIPEADLLEVDALVQRRTVKITRHHWLLEAIHEKILREKEERREDRRRPNRDQVPHA